MSLPRYPKYKDSGVEWLGKVPEHWEVYALKRIANLQSGDTISPDDIEEDGQYPVFGGNGLRGYTTNFTHDGTHALIGRQGALCGNINYAHGKFWASEHAVVVSTLNNVETVWLGELLRAMNLNQYSVSAAQPGLSVDIIRNLFIAVPPLQEQYMISAFLDREKAKIDALVEEQRQLIELLKEKRQAVISHAVTKGLNPHAKMRPSGIEWLGDVPAHWEVKKFGHISAVVRGASPRPAGDERYFNGEFIPWITVGEITKDTDMCLISTEEMLTKEGADLSRTIESGTLVLTNSGATLGVPKILSITGCANDGILAFFKLHQDASKQFLYYYLSSLTENLRDRVKQGSGQPNLNTDIVKTLAVPWPARNEQNAIATFLDMKTTEFDTLVEQVVRAIDLLQERRTALISAAVTGKIDVRGQAGGGHEPALISSSLPDKSSYNIQIS